MTATTLGLALTSTRPTLVVEADPTGGSAILAGYLRGGTTPPDSLIDLAVANRHGALAEALPRMTVPVSEKVSFVPGTRSHTQARSLGALWESLATVLRGLERTGQDVIVDAGRLGLLGSPEPLIRAADLCLLATRSDLVSLSAARSWGESLRDDFERLGGAASLGVLMIGEGHPYRAREVRSVLQIPVAASLAWDPETARVFSRGAKAPKRFDTSPLVRSLRAAHDRLEATVESNRAELERAV
ncbi:MAG: hypothetical protein L0G89_00335 [Janibacter sp.]|nr:hypothetical protein [Janibacter sp.]